MSSRIAVSADRRLNLPGGNATVSRSHIGPLTKVRKLNLAQMTAWPHHRGGWNFVCRLMAENLHCDDGTDFSTAVEDEIFEGRVFARPWSGFLHQVPRHRLPWFPDLERLLQDPAFQASLPHCQGLFVLSSQLKDYLTRKGIGVPVARILYPFMETSRTFRIDSFSSAARRRVIFVGEYLRRYEAFAELHAPGFEKALLKPEKFDARRIQEDPNIAVLDRVDDREYDRLLEESIVFLCLEDAPANTTVLECIARATPLLINRLPGVVEYLGSDYPFFYESLDEASEKLQDENSIRRTWEYLNEFPQRSRLTPGRFLDSIHNSAIYRSLPTPSSQRKAFPHYDVSVVMCSYKRVYNMDAILKGLSEQDFSGRFEVLIWNNNYDARQELDAFYEKYSPRMDIRLMHSTENFYCIIRLAMASLIQSEVILIIDDDVFPKPGYIRRFMEKRREYGPEAVLCCRGHVFLPHELDEEEPHRFWSDYRHMRFFDESQDDRQVHFLHADNCLIPKSVMARAAGVPIEKRDYILVDDYWLSYVISGEFELPIWKIKADDVVDFSRCSDDPDIALFHNPKVNEQRINLYIDLIRRGWPYPNEDPVRAVGCGAEAAERPKPESKIEVWRKGFRGANLYSEASSDEYREAASLGIRVLRLGAVGAARDFRYLVDEHGRRAVIDDRTVSRLFRFLGRARECGQKVILTLCNVPGRLVRQKDADLRIWADPAAARAFVDMWRQLARILRNCEHIIGYDLINEPYRPDDTAWDRESTAPSDYDTQLQRLYRNTIEAIRESDPHTPIVLEGSRWASPYGLLRLEPLADEKVVYSFHMYLPPLITNRSQNKGRYTYPGPAPEWDKARWKTDQIYWDKDRLRKRLQIVADWQRGHGLAGHRILVGEFGVCRDINGAERYLRDLAGLFDEFGWNWCFYAFRDQEWDAMNYELGTDLANMLASCENPLMETLAKHFR